ncbi:MAG: hypothetical protein LUH14_11515 [Clostridiaceae bacterium]|nr:hypothetical protein [Clostridiaceae bacterium]
MPIFLICIIVFVIWFRVKLKRADSAKKPERDAFWEREEKANFIRKQDISQLDYLTVSPDALPFGTPVDEQEEALQTNTKKCISRKMLNLTQYSNTDLKEKYGAANLDELTVYDQNFVSFIRSLCSWGTYLYEKDDLTRAKQIMEYSLSVGSDISAVYTTLAQIYARQNEYPKIDTLIASVENSGIALKDSIIRQLRLCKLK